MLMMTKISIITINKNNAEGLKKTIQSVIQQTYTNIEYIVIDGASIDNSLDVISSFVEKITHWVSETDSGIFNAMNKGVKKSSGDYCYFLNSGDVLASKDTLSDIFRDRIDHSPFINGHQINLIDSKQKRVKALNRPLTLFDFYWGTIKHQATFIHRQMFLKYGLYDENLKITADWKFFLQTIGLHNEQPIFVDIDIVHFEWGGVSTNLKWLKIHDEERIRVINECIPLSIQNDYNRFHFMSSNKYILDKMRDNRLFSFLVKGLYKILK